MLLRPLASLLTQLRTRGMRVGAALGALLGLGLLAAWLAWPTGATFPSMAPAPTGPDPLAHQLTLSRLRTRLSRPFFLRSEPGPQAPRIPYSPAELGVELDKARLRQLVRHPTADVPPEPFAPIRLNLDRAVPVLLALKAQLDRPPRDARLSLEGGPPRPERWGRRLDIDASLLAVKLAIEDGRQESTLVFLTQAPRRLASQLEGIRQDVRLGSFETPYDRSRKAQARTFNLRLAASRLNGTVLLPGDTFDFNKVVGPRDEANGYQVASVIAQGEVVDGIGGGTCQISGTLHAAALFAGLEIVERHPHTRPSSYIKLGFDAAVVYPAMNLKLRNPHDFSIVIRETVNDGKVTAQILGPQRPHRITVIRKIDRAFPFERLERPDPTLGLGMRRVTQQGVPGLQLHRYRISQAGRHSKREKTVDHYPATPEITRVGTNPKLPSTGRSLTARAREYLPDELLVMSQQDDPDSPLLIRKEPGRYGLPGWAEALAQEDHNSGR